MKQKHIIAFSIATGAWLNIWPPLIWKPAGFIAAYAAVFFALAFHAFRKD